MLFRSILMSKDLLFSPSSDFLCFSGPTGPRPMEHDGAAIEVSSDSDEAVDRAVWTASESSAAAGHRFFGRFKPWTNLTLDDVSGGPDGTPVVDLSDIVSARSALDSLEEARRNFAATLL